MNIVSWLINSAEQNSAVFLLVIYLQTQGVQTPCVCKYTGCGLRLSKCGVILTNNIKVTGVSQEVIKLLDMLDGWGVFTIPHTL